MALQPINGRQKICSDISRMLNGYSKILTVEEQEKQSLIDSWASNIGITKVYRNFDFTRQYEMIISEGKFEEDELPYKKFQLAPFYDEWILNVGDYITFEYRGRMATMLISSLDGQFQYRVKGKMYNCNNTLHLVDEYGYIHNYPVVFNDKALRTDFFYSPNGNIQNGRVEVDLQYNEYTSQIKTNERFLFGGLAYKVTYISTNMNQFFDSNDGTITLNLVVDEKANGDDDIENNITNASRLSKYQLICDIDEIVGHIEDEGFINAYVTKDGIKCDEPILYEVIQENEVRPTPESECNLTCHYWYSECPSEKPEEIDYIMNVDKEGNYKLLKLGKCKVKVYMKNNPDKFKIIEVEVNDIPVEDEIRIEIIPNEQFVLQGKSKEFICKKYINNIESDEILTITDVSTIKTGYYNLTIEGNKFTIENIRKHGSKKVEIDITDGTITEHMSIELKGVW